MKKLYLIRHAKSSWDDPNLDDFLRPLNTRGEKDAPSMGKRLKEKHVTANLLISSPATRAIETCKAIATVLNYPIEKIKIEKRLYHASAEQILQIVKELTDKPQDDDEIVFLFGHNPGITDFANELLNEHINTIPTCGIVASKIYIKNWKGITFGCGKIEFFDFPKNKSS